MQSWSIPFDIDSRVIIFLVCTFFPYMCMCFMFKVPFCFPLMLEWVYNDLEFISIWSISLLLSIHKTFLLKLMMDSSLIDAHIDGLCLISSISPENKIFDYEDIATLPLLNFLCNSPVNVYCLTWLHAQCALVSTTIKIKFFFLLNISGLWDKHWEIPLFSLFGEKEANFLS